MFALQNLINALKKRLKISNNCKLVKKKGKKKKNKDKKYFQQLEYNFNDKMFSSAFWLNV